MFETDRPILFVSLAYISVNSLCVKDIFTSTLHIAKLYVQPTKLGSEIKLVIFLI